MDLLPMALANGWASGINSYLVVLVLGLVDRVGSFDQIPNVLARMDVLVVAGVLFVWEFVADKIPYVDSTWDAISTVIRPTIGAVVGVLLAGDADTLEQAIYAVTGGGAALLSHLVKAGTRLAVNTSPEPVTNSVVSVTEDVAVLGVVGLAIEHPALAAGVAVVLLIAGLVLLFFALRLVRRGWRRWKGKEPRVAPTTAA